VRGWVDEGVGGEEVRGWVEGGSEGGEEVRGVGGGRRGGEGGGWREGVREERSVRGVGGEGGWERGVEMLLEECLDVWKCSVSDV